MRFADSGASPATKAATLSAHDRLARADADAHAYGVGTCFRFAFAVLPDTLCGNRLAVPAVEAEDTIRLRNDVPALDIR